MPPPSDSPQVPPTRLPRILSVDDRAGNQEVLEAMMGGACTVFVRAHSASEALALVESSDAPFDVVFVDFELPDMDGIALATRLRALPATADMPRLIAISANGAEHMEDRSPAGLFDAYLGKPVRRRQLLALVAELTA